MHTSCMSSVLPIFTFRSLSAWKHRQIGARTSMLVALTLLSWSSIRLLSAVRLYGDYLLPFSVSLPNRHIVFLLINASVISLLLLSRQHDAGCIRCTGDLYNEYFQNSETSQRTSPVWTGKHIVCLENAVVQTACDAVEFAGTELKRFKRTRSGKLKQELHAKPGLESTEMHRRILPGVTKRSISPLDTMDTLSNEAFQQAIEAYIAKHRKFIHQKFKRRQRMVDEND